MKILVTGANGYIGTGVVRELLSLGHDVYASGRDTNKICDGAHKIKGDIFEIDNPFSHFDRPDVLLHLAWENGFVHNDPSHILNLSKHYVFLKKMIDGGIKHIAIMGSMHEIGFFEGSINENTPTHPESLYGISKDALRNISKLLCKNSNVVWQWLRGFYIVGNSENGSSIFSKITKYEKNGEKLFPFTTGQNQWDFIDYDEFCRQTAMAVSQTRINGIINICSGKPEKLSDRVERFIKDNNYKIKLDYGKFPDRPYDSKAIWGDNSKIIEICGR